LGAREHDMILHFRVAIGDLHLLIMRLEPSDQIMQRDSLEINALLDR
jgi:hypothetical protein